ncbi:MAG TPA: MbtH family NRPS accessory protein, partial [Chloroflexota bacterium]|nr:MbtH family NRPS accessory protein [Chloroflexota bacterium]
TAGAPGRKPGRIHARSGALPRDGAGPFPTTLNSERRGMPTDATEDTRTYIVLVNHEEQYSLWLADKKIPLGWSAVGEPGSKEECLAYVEEVWTDMTPKSLRKQTQEA